MTVIYSHRKGKTTKKEAFIALVNGLDSAKDTAPKDGDYFISQFHNGNDESINNNSYLRRPFSAVWNYIKAKADPIFVKKTGDDMTGDLFVHNTSKNNAKVTVQGATDAKVSLMIGTGGHTHGIWSDTLRKWIAYATDEDNSVHLLGKADSSGRVVSRGNVIAETGTTDPAVKGISMSQSYKNGYAESYGNVLTLSALGDSQLYMGWNPASLYYRSKSDTSGSEWVDWKKVAFTDSNITGNAASATKATQDSDGNVINTTYVKKDDIPIATNSKIGGIKPDGTTITVDKNGVATASAGNITETFLAENYVKKSGGYISKTMSGIVSSSSRTLPSAGSTIDVNLGRINKYLSDLRPVAFNEHFSNLSGVPITFLTAIYIDSWESASNQEYKLVNFLNSHLMLIYHCGAASTSTNTGADDREILWAVFGGWFSGTSTSTANPHVRIVALGSRGSTSRGTITSISDDAHSGYNIKVSVPKGSASYFRFFVVGSAVGNIYLSRM